MILLAFYIKAKFYCYVKSRLAILSILQIYPWYHIDNQARIVENISSFPFPDLFLSWDQFTLDLKIVCGA
jgi:hypothetical protein